MQVRIDSRITQYEDLGEGRGVKVVCEDGTEAFGDVLVGADGIWSSIRKVGCAMPVTPPRPRSKGGPPPAEPGPAHRFPGLPAARPAPRKCSTASPHSITSSARLVTVATITGEGGGSHKCHRCEA